ncbi:hypothetical protein SeLEV6574_g00859 [Synchytrium endobioticum]|uniref:Uncharacterized protein n=1 Tax=Synchytrium endobioticum TaxID=286115 RepID=A0A507DGM1_9FUNG|nr:hypothetical protein SeLEV6574_g00859 [Synchytrium endobioticum]
MAKFITISLLAYAAAFLFFTPDRAVGITKDETCIRDFIFAVIDPITGTDPFSIIRERVNKIVIETAQGRKAPCYMHEILEVPENLDKDRITPVRKFHAYVFKQLKTLFERLTKAINDTNNYVQQTLRMAQALVWPDMINHLHLERKFRASKGIVGGTPLQNELELPPFVWETFERYVDENEYLVSALNALSGILGALPAPPSSAHELPVNSDIRHDGPDFLYTAPHGSAPILGSTNPGIQLSDGYNDPQCLPYDTEFALPAHEQVGPSSSGTLNNPYDYGDDEPNFVYVSSHQAPPSPELTHIYKDPEFIQYEIELGRRAHEQAGPSGGSTSYSDSRNKQHNERRNIRD